MLKSQKAVPKSYSSLPCELLALRKAVINVLSDIGRNSLAELLDVLAINGLREAERSIEDASIEVEEVLSNLAGTGVLVVQSRDESSRLALRVELVVDAAHGKDGAFELAQAARNLSVLTRGYESVLEDISEIDSAFDDGKELGGAGVDMRGVDAASVEEAEGS